LERNSRNKPNISKANALLCPTCCVEYLEVEFDFEVNGVILHSVKALRCPGCDKEMFSPEQHDAIQKLIIDSMEF
jgi:hypothetical protein